MLQIHVAHVCFASYFRYTQLLLVVLLLDSECRSHMCGYTKCSVVVFM